MKPIYNFRIMLNQFHEIKVGFGDKNGRTTQTVLRQKANIISLGDISKTTKKIELHPKIYGNFKNQKIGELTRKKRDRKTLQELLKLDVECNYDAIYQQCENVETKIANDLAILGAMMEETKGEKFMKQTGSNAIDAKKYLDKYGSMQEAVRTYRKHQDKINKFIKQNNCSKQNAISFLESCDYNDEFLH